MGWELYWNWIFLDHFKLCLVRRNIFCFYRLILCSPRIHIRHIPVHMYLRIQAIYVGLYRNRVLLYKSIIMMDKISSLPILMYTEPFLETESSWLHVSKGSSLTYIEFLKYFNMNKQIKHISCDNCSEKICLHNKILDSD